MLNLNSNRLRLFGPDGLFNSRIPKQSNLNPIYSSNIHFSINYDFLLVDIEPY